MHRSIGKRIRMDEPPPPEYETIVNSMTPGYVSDVQETFSPFMSYRNPDSNMDPNMR